MISERKPNLRGFSQIIIFSSPLLETVFSSATPLRESIGEEDTNKLTFNFYYKRERSYHTNKFYKSDPEAQGRNRSSQFFGLRFRTLGEKKRTPNEFQMNTSGY